MNPPFLRPSNLSTPKLPFFLSSHFNFSKPNNPNFKLFHKPYPNFPNFSFNSHFVTRRNLSTICSLNSPVESNDDKSVAETSPPIQSDFTNRWNLVEICNPNFPPFVSSLVPKFSWSDQAFFLLTFIAFTTSAALVGFVAAAVPSLHAMGRAANSLAKLADAAREELPSTMAAIRLSGMEISDLTLELSDLSQEISEGVNKSAQAVQAAENGIRQIGALARKQTASLIEERASLPVINLQPVVSGAAEKTSRAVGYATRTFMNLISGVEFSSENKDDSVDRLDT